MSEKSLKSKKQTFLALILIYFCQKYYIQIIKGVFLALILSLSRDMSAQSQNENLWPSPNYPQFVEYIDSVAGKVEFGWDSKDDDKWFAYWKENYEKNHFSRVEPDKEPRVPKVFHQIWVGNAKLSEDHKGLMKTFKETHPDWDYKLWTDEDVQYLDLGPFQALYDSAPNFGQKSDILRYWLLYYIGGVYIDVDVKCLNRRFDILNHCYDFFIGSSTSTPVGVGIGVIGCAPGHPLMKHILDGLHNLKNVTNFLQILHGTGPVYFCKQMMEILPDCSGRNMVFPRTYFYPSPNTRRNLSWSQQDLFIKPESFTNHYWTCSWMKKEAFQKK